MDKDFLAALALHGWFGHTELVDTVAQGLQRLIQGVLAQALDLTTVEHQGNLPFCWFGRASAGQDGELICNHFFGCVLCLLGRSAQAQRLPHAFDLDTGHICFAQHSAQLFGVLIQGILESFFQIDTEQQMRAAAQVQT